MSAPNHWPLERVLFLMAGTVTILSVILAVTLSPWFLILTAFVGASQWMFVAFGDCPSSFVMRKLFRLEGCQR
ncbi:MAG: DUF2892 domain-containing protein [Miltoncostaeaceae bacterium]